jgi:hypothetical protein
VEDFMRKFASLVAAGAMVLSSTAAFAADEGALSAGKAVEVHQAQDAPEGWHYEWVVITIAGVATLIAILVADSGSSTHT